MNSRLKTTSTGVTGILLATLSVGCGLLPKTAKTEPSNSTAQGQQQGQGLPLETRMKLRPQLSLNTHSQA